jgi:hypothetical protein
MARWRRTVKHEAKIFGSALHTEGNVEMHSLKGDSIPTESLQQPSEIFQAEVRRSDARMATFKWGIGSENLEGNSLSRPLSFAFLLVVSESKDRRKGVWSVNSQKWEGRSFSPE